MKTLAVALFVSLIPFAQAEDIDCQAGSSEIISQIALSSTCRQASDAALSCASGAGSDVSLAGAAERICLSETGALSSVNQRLLNSMNDSCRKAFGTRAGSTYQSLEAFCRLDAVKFIHNIATDRF